MAPKSGTDSDYIDISERTELSTATATASSKDGLCNRTTIIMTVVTVFVVLVVFTAVLLGLLSTFDVVQFVSEDDADDSSFYEKISIYNIQQHLTNLQQIAVDNQGSRAVQFGYNASVEYVKSQLSETDYIISEQYFTITVPSETQNPTLSQTLPFPQTFVYSEDFIGMTYGGSGVVQAPVFLASNFGCNVSDFSGFDLPDQPIIALIARGECNFADKVSNAINAINAAAVLIYNYNSSTDPVAGTLGNAVSIPVLGITYTLAEELISIVLGKRSLARLRDLDPSQGTLLEAQLAVSGYGVVSQYTTMNLFADTPKGNNATMIVQGSHLDSVPAGPGINDNGSGSSSNLEIALQFYRSKVSYENKVRFAWWGAEELGLLGSSYYVSSLTPEEKASIACNLNYDMLGSPNYIRGILNANLGPNAFKCPGCDALTNLYASFFSLHNYPFEYGAFTNRSDYGPFATNDIPAGGLQTGAEVIKTIDERSSFGGYVNVPYDPCYHQACDTFNNVNFFILGQNAQAAAYVLQTLANEKNLTQFLQSGTTPK